VEGKENKKKQNVLGKILVRLLVHAYAKQKHGLHVPIAQDSWIQAHSVPQCNTFRVFPLITCTANVLQTYYYYYYYYYY
jgi:hypothetical protein